MVDARLVAPLTVSWLMVVAARLLVPVTVRLARVVPPVTASPPEKATAPVAFNVVSTVAPVTVKAPETFTALVKAETPETVSVLLMTTGPLTVTPPTRLTVPVTVSWEMVVTPRLLVPETASVVKEVAPVTLSAPVTLAWASVVKLPRLLGPAAVKLWRLVVPVTVREERVEGPALREEIVVPCREVVPVTVRDWSVDGPFTTSCVAVMALADVVPLMMSVFRLVRPVTAKLEAEMLPLVSDPVTMLVAVTGPRFDGPVIVKEVPLMAPADMEPTVSAVITALAICAVPVTTRFVVVEVPVMVKLVPTNAFATTVPPTVTFPQTKRAGTSKAHEFLLPLPLLQDLSRLRLLLEE